MKDIEALIKRAQELNRSESYSEVADILWLGIETPRDVKRAIIYYKKAADLGSAYSQSKLGQMYYYGKNLPQDKKLAKYYFKEAAVQNNIIALEYLGKMCYEGDYGFWTGKGKAFSYWERAAKLGSTYAQYNIATSYLDDKWGAEKDYKKAAFWFMCAYQNRKATEKQIVESKKNLDALSRYVNLNSIYAEIVKKYQKYLNL